MKLILIITTMLLSCSLHAELSFYSGVDREVDYAPLDQKLTEDVMSKAAGCENLKDDFTFAFPLEDKSLPIASSFSKARTVNGVTEPHWGVDFNAKYGANVYAAHDGVVTAAYEDTKWGNGKHVVLKTNDGQHGTAYLHLSRISTKQNAKVKVGDIIGAVGNSGYSTGVHLHFSYKLWCSAVNDFVYRNPAGKFSDYPIK